jgi:hypothetical protein
MATEYTASVASGYATNVLFYSDGPFRIMNGHYSAPSADTGYIETGFRHIDTYYIQDADPTTIIFSSTSTSASAPPATLAVFFSGMVTGATGYFEIKGW